MTYKQLVGITAYISLLAIVSGVCLDENIGDGVCDTDCLLSNFSFDFGDCCESSMVGNGECNIECLSQEFMFDAGDCCEVENCFKFKLGDGTCDEDCVTVECAYDGGDCQKCFTDDEDNESVTCDEHLSSCAVNSDQKCNVHIFADNFCDNDCRIGSCFDDNNDCVLTPGWRFFQVVMTMTGCFLIVMLFLVVYSLLFRREKLFQRTVEDDTEEINPDLLPEYPDETNNESSGFIVFKGSSKNLQITPNLKATIEKPASRRQISRKVSHLKEIADVKHAHKASDATAGVQDYYSDSEDLSSPQMIATKAKTPREEVLKVDEDPVENNE